MDRAVFWALAGVVALAPLPLGGNRAWAWSGLSLAVGLLLVAWAVAAWRRPAIAHFPWRLIGSGAAVFGALVVWFFIQASGGTPPGWHHPIWQQTGDALGLALPGAVSLSPEQTITGAMRLICYAGVFFLTAQSCRLPERARTMFWTVALAGLAYAIYGLYLAFANVDMILWFERWAYRGSLTSTFVNRNSYASYAGLTLVIILALMNSAVGKSLDLGLGSRTGIIHFVDNLKPQLFFLVSAFAVIATALLLSQSRGGLLATFIGVAAYFAMLGLRRQFRSRTAIGAALTVLVAGAILVSFSGSATLSRFADYAAEGSGRDAVFALTARAIGEHPLLGTGLGSFRGVFQLFRDAAFGVLAPAYQQAHSSYLELALEAGLPAFALTMMLLASLAALCLRGVLKRQRNLAYPAAGLGATALVAAHSAVDFSLQIPGVTITYMAIMGAAVGQSFRSKRRKGENRIAMDAGS
ncbi:MAG: O-antigen ligase family protein [Alphaproteobacteria bacterium]